MLKLDFINVGYGDAILIREEALSGERYSMLIDSGDLTTGEFHPGCKRISAARFLEKQGIRHLDLLVLTHLHLDHAGGLAALLPGVSVGEFWTNYLPEQSLWTALPCADPSFSNGANCLLRSMKVYVEALSAMRKEGTAIRLLDRSGSGGTFGTGELKIRIFCGNRALLARQKVILDHVLQGAPDGKELDELDRFINNTSIRLRLAYGGRAVELPGDIYASCWAGYPPDRCDLLKVPHHGHRDSLTPQILDALAPQYAVLSVSNSRTDDCPSKKILELLHAAGCRVFVTDAVQIDGGPPRYHESVSFSIGRDGTMRTSEAQEGVSRNRAAPEGTKIRK